MKVLTMAVVAATLFSGCVITAKTKTRYTSDTNPTVQAADAWNGEPIVIQADGVSISVNGGLKVVGDPSATKISATARVLAMSDNAEEANAKKSIADVIATLKVERVDGKFRVSCGHAAADYGTSSRGDAGCELLTVTVPVGSATKPLDITAGSGNGDLSVTGSLIVKNALIQADGGDVTADLVPVQGAEIRVKSLKADDATLIVPANTQADVVTIVGDQTKSSSGFSTVTPNVDGSIGTQGAGAKLLNVESLAFAGTRGAAKLVAK
jgi:hypothetical protein